MAQKYLGFGKTRTHIHIVCICTEYLLREMQKTANTGCLQKEQVASRGT